MLFIEVSSNPILPVLQLAKQDFFQHQHIERQEDNFPATVEISRGQLSQSPRLTTQKIGRKDEEVQRRSVAAAGRTGTLEDN